MRRFHSYGPVDSQEHFAVSRRDLIRHCADQLIDNPDKGGHYFTIWAPRQTGKTWRMRQVKAEIERGYGDQFIVGTMSMQGVTLKPDDAPEKFFELISGLFWRAFKRKPSYPIQAWKDWANLFAIEQGIFDRPVILFIDEFDSLPSEVIDQLVTLFRDMYLDRSNYRLHGLALIGVRAALGIGSQRGSPFNVQRALHVPNFTPAEVQDLFGQYQTESGQTVVSEVVDKVYRVTRGQPGLVGWFGELLTEKYNPGAPQLIDLNAWETAYLNARFTEWNNTVLNMLTKARQEPYRSYVLALFTRQDMPFTIDSEWCNFLYLNGIMDHETLPGGPDGPIKVCQFSCPFIQLRLYNALTSDLAGEQLPIPPLDFVDDLADVFAGPTLDMPALLRRYRDYLKRLKAKGINPWKDQPRRQTDYQLTEAVGHFHLYAWLQAAVGRRCAVSPEFPTGNGKVDLHLRCGERRSIIEVKSFTDAYQLKENRRQAAAYARQLGLVEVTVAVFVPTDDESVLAQLSSAETLEGVRVTLIAIGWV